MNNTPIQDSFIFTRAFVARNLAVLLFFVTLISLNAQALQTTPHWEEIDGNNRYGYWQEYIAGHEEDQGYWDSSIYTGQGHYEYYCKPIYDEEGNFVGEEAAVETWVNDPVWVSVMVWVDTIWQWVDMPQEHDYQDDYLDIYSVELLIAIRPDNVWVPFVAGDKAYAYIEWSVDRESGNVSIGRMRNEIYQTSSWITSGGYVNIVPNLSAQQSSVGLNGTAWTYADPFQWGQGDENPYNINWNLCVDVDHSRHGSVSGSHDRFPSYNIKSNNITVYDFVQQYGAFRGMAWGLIQQEEVALSF
jgi:hypothetical protein